MRLFPVESEAVDKRSLPVDEVNGLMEVERERAKERQGKRVDLLEGNIRQHVAYPVTQGKSTDVVGEKLGVSGEMAIPKRRSGRCLGWNKGRLAV